MDHVDHIPQTTENQSSPCAHCEVCGATSPILRRGRCAACYVQWSVLRPVGFGASCTVCGERRREHLRQTEFQQRWVSMCHDCAGRAMLLSPMPMTVEGLRQRLTRDRRWNERRHNEHVEWRFPYEKRIGDRRSVTPSGFAGHGAIQHSAHPDDDAWCDAAELIIEALEANTDVDAAAPEEVTRIAQAPTS